jgi:S1-C subfamily serine protease
VVSALAAAALLAAPAYPDAPNLVPLVNRAEPSVAFVLSKDEKDQPVVSGTAFVVSPNGLLLTALHVVDEASSVSVLLPNHRPLGADVVAVDTEHDVALLNVPSLPRPGPPALALGDSNKLEAGESVVALGYPLPTSPQSPIFVVNKGIISAVRTPAGYVQIDAPINPGDSGGPVLTTDGKVIGVIDASVRGAQNINFAVPIGFAAALVDHATAAGPATNPMPLPLTKEMGVPLAYSSHGIGPHGKDEHVGVACVQPPHQAAVLDDVQVQLQVEGTLHVVTWLSWEKGAQLDSQDSFGRLDATTVRNFAGTIGRLHLQPDTICLNYTAWNDSGVPIGYTFTVTYTLGFRIFPGAAAPPKP